MRFRWKIPAILLLLALVALASSCEDSDVTAPSGSVMTLVASPSSVFIDQSIGEESGKTTLVAQVVDGSGLPLQDIPVFFTTSGGLLASVNNICVASLCSRTGTACVSNGDCPFVAPEPILTNNSGVALDELTLRLIEDPESVDVTVQATSLTAMTTVTKTVNLGPVDAVAVIEATPPNGQRTGLPFSFSGASSSFDPQVDLECFEWTISSQLIDEVIRGDENTAVTIGFTLGEENEKDEEQDLLVILRVSDDPDYPCTPCGGNFPPCIDTPPPGVFSTFDDQLFYPVECDLTDPILIAPPDQFGDLNQPGGGTFDLSATANDPEDPTLDFTWVCQGALPPAGGNSQSVQCTWTQPGDYTVNVSVQNSCGRITVDSLTVTLVN